MDQTRRYVIPAFSIPSSAGAYAVGNEVSNSATAGSVVRGTIDLSMVRKARPVRASIAITPASGNLVIAALDLALLLFKTADAPAAVGDRVALNIPAQTRNKGVIFTFANTAWTQPTGALTAGTDGFQEKLPAVAIAGSGAIAGPIFDFFKASDVANIAAHQLTVVVQAEGTWTPGAVVNQFDIVFDIEIEE